MGKAIQCNIDLEVIYSGVKIYIADINFKTRACIPSYTNRHLCPSYRGGKTTQFMRSRRTAATLAHATSKLSIICWNAVVFVATLS